MPQKTYDESFWNQRYTGEHFVYGTEPNTFLAKHAGVLTSPVLSLSEGEGRNAVFLASLGLDVLGVDISSVGLEKARQLAQSRGVKIRTEVADLATYEPGQARFGAVVSIFAHLPGAIRQRLSSLGYTDRLSTSYVQELPGFRCLAGLPGVLEWTGNALTSFDPFPRD